LSGKTYLYTYKKHLLMTAFMLTRLLWNLCQFRAECRLKGLVVGIHF